MTACRGCGADIPPRLAWPRHCNAACLDLAIERAITGALYGFLRDGLPRGRPKSVDARFCAWCHTKLPPDRKKFCSRAHIVAFRAAAKARAA